MAALSPEHFPRARDYIHLVHPESIPDSLLQGDRSIKGVAGATLAEEPQRGAARVYSMPTCLRHGVGACRAVASMATFPHPQHRGGPR